MIIFVVNCGSSSIKYQLLNMNGEQVLAKGLIERIGMEGSVLKHTPTGKYTVDISAEIPDHSVGIQMALDALTNEEYGVIDSMDEIDAVGHRVQLGSERIHETLGMMFFTGSRPALRLCGCRFRGTCMVSKPVCA